MSGGSYDPPGRRPARHAMGPYTANQHSLPLPTHCQFARRSRKFPQQSLDVQNTDYQVVQPGCPGRDAPVAYPLVLISESDSVCRVCDTSFCRKPRKSGVPWTNFWLTFWNVVLCSTAVFQYHLPGSRAYRSAQTARPDCHLCRSGIW